MKNLGQRLFFSFFSFRYRHGLTMIELLIFVGLFTLVIVGFISVLVLVININSRQTSANEVNVQSQYLLEQIKYYVERSSLIDISQDTSTSTLRLRMKSSSEDPTIFTVASGTAYIQKGSGGQTALTSSRVTVSSLTFRKRSNPPGKDSVDVSFLMQYNTQNLKQSFFQSLSSGLTRVSAATFDSNLIPSSTATYKLGTTGAVWSSINDVIYFNGSTVGIGVSSPNAVLQVSGGDVYVDTVGKGILLRSSDGVCWRIKPSTAGAYTSASTTCP